MLDGNEINKNLIRCPRCGRPRTIVKETTGFFNFRPGNDHVVAFLRCDHDDCSYDILRYLVVDNEKDHQM